MVRDVGEGLKCVQECREKVEQDFEECWKALKSVGECLRVFRSV